MANMGWPPAGYSQKQVKDVVADPAQNTGEWRSMERRRLTTLCQLVINSKSGRSPDLTWRLATLSAALM